MHFSSRSVSFFSLATLVAFVHLATPLRAQTPAAIPGPADQAAAQALDLANSGKTKEAIDAYTAVIKTYPTSSVVSEAQFRLGYLNYLLGNYDPSITALKKILAPPAPPEIQELAYNLLPQVYAAKAGKLAPTDPKRAAAFDEAIKQFDVFLQKFPTSDEVESANYGRALASFQIEKYDDAAKSLRENLQKFQSSESILDSQYLLALVFATQANNGLRAPNATDAARTQSNTQFDDAVKLLRNIVQRNTDVVLANDAQFQIGEVLFSRAGSVDPAQRKALFDDAITAYRSVEPKELMVKAQEQHIATIFQRIRAAAAARNVKEIKRLQSLQEHEQAKLPMVQEAADKTVSAQIKVGTCFYLEQKYDAARVLFHQVQQFATDAEQKKEILYFTTMTYSSAASQSGPDIPVLTPEPRAALVQQAVAGYDEFQKSYKGDPIADNLPFAMGAMFLSGDAQTNNPDKAIQYLKDSLQFYPKGRFVNESLNQQANALVSLKRYDEATDIYKKYLATKPPKDQAAGAEFGMATIAKDTGKIDAAVAGFKNVRDNFAGTPPAEQATFWVGQLLLGKGDAKSAIPELQRYVKAFPEGTLAPAADFGLAQAQALAGDKTSAVQTYEEVETKFPKSEAAPFAYFARATIFAADQKADEMIKEMRKFIETYPDSDKVYFAYDSIGQNLTNAQKPLEAIAVYAEMAEKHPQNSQAPAALYQAAELWRHYAESQGRYIALNEQQRAEWTKGIEGSVAAGEKLVQQYPESPQVALVLQTLLEDQKLLALSKLKTPEQVEQYFQNLAAKESAQPATKSKILFTLASFIYEKDKTKALAQMQAAYDPKLVYAPADLDLYGTALLANGKVDDARAVYEKLAQDFPNPAGVSPDKAPPQIAAAQAIALYGTGKCLQQQGKVAEAGQKFDQLKKLYPWSPKILEANFGIAQSLVPQNKLDEAMALLVQIIRAPTATAELRANSMLLGGEIQEKKNALEPAIDYYLKIAAFYESVAPAASEGLWHGGQLLERQAASLPDTAPDKNKPTPTKPGQLAKAVRAYKDLVEKYSSSPLAVQAKERLAQLAPGK